MKIFVISTEKIIFHSITFQNEYLWIDILSFFNIPLHKLVAILKWKLSNIHNDLFIFPKNKTERTIQDFIFGICQYQTIFKAEFDFEMQGKYRYIFKFTEFKSKKDIWNHW